MQTDGVLTEDSAERPAVDPADPPARWSSLLARAILAVLGLLLVEVLLEGWLVTLFGTPGLNADNLPAMTDPATWPKTLKSALYFLLFGLTVAKLLVDGTWRRLKSKADIALVVLGVIMVAAGLVGGSSLTLIGEALFVYFRGVIVFYAVRALSPTWRQMQTRAIPGGRPSPPTRQGEAPSLRPLFWVAGGFVTVNFIFAGWQFINRLPAYTALGWVDEKWAQENRAQGLVDHPNDLGHLAGLVLLGLMAWFVTREKVKARWWVLFVLTALTLAIAQSRQSSMAVVAGFVVIAVVRRTGYRRMIMGFLVVVLLSALPVLLDQDNREKLAYRFGGIFNALLMSGGKDSKKDCANNPRCKGIDGEIRVLFAKQGGKLFAASPLLGYGVGQFGGIVAVKDDPQWNEDPRFVEVLGSDGFFLHGFESVSVDVFWLHLLVEVGALGVLAYLAWLFLLTVPILQGARSTRGSPEKEWVLLFAAATMAFAVVIAAWSPALEDPLFPPLLFGLLGFAWVLLRPDGDQDIVRAGKAE